MEDPLGQSLLSLLLWWLVERSAFKVQKFFARFLGPGPIWSNTQALRTCSIILARGQTWKQNWPYLTTILVWEWQAQVKATVCTLNTRSWEQVLHHTVLAFHGDSEVGFPILDLREWKPGIQPLRLGTQSEACSRNEGGVPGSTPASSQFSSAICPTWLRIICYIAGPGLFICCVGFDLEKLENVCSLHFEPQEPAKHFLCACTWYLWHFPQVEVAPIANDSSSWRPGSASHQTNVSKLEILSPSGEFSQLLDPPGVCLARLMSQVETGIIRFLVNDQRPVRKRCWWSRWICPSWTLSGKANLGRHWHLPLRCSTKTCGRFLWRRWFIHA